MINSHNKIIVTHVSLDIANVTIIPLIYWFLYFMYMWTDDNDTI